MQSPDVIANDAGHQRVTVAALFVAYLAGFGVFIPFFPVWLGFLGLSAGWIAVLVAVPLVIRVLTTSFVADLAERADDPRQPLLWLSIATVLLFAILPVLDLLGGETFSVSSPWVLLMVIAAMAVGWNALLPLCDALGIQVSKQTGTAYGILRVGGSISFVVVSFAAGVAIDRYGVSIIPWLILAAFSSLIVVSLLLPESVRHKPADAGSAVHAAKMRSGWVCFLRRKGAMSVFIGAGLMQASHAMLYSFGSLSWGSQGFSETSIGLLWAFGVVCEVVLFFVSAPIIARIGARGLLIVGGIGATIRWVALAFAPDLFATAALQVLHALSFGMSHLALIAYTTRRARPRELRAAQGVYGVVSGALMAAATLAAGPLYEQFGAFSYMAMAGMTALGVAIIVVNRVRIPGGEPNRTA
ncbi:MAG: MFS transporter [Cohaesibacteraceae bacterium]